MTYLIYSSMLGHFPVIVEAHRFCLRVTKSNQDSEFLVLCLFFLFAIIHFILYMWINDGGVVQK